MLSNQGVVRITDTGVEIISQGIEPEITPLLSLTSLSSLAYGIGYESDHTYWMSVPETSSDTANSQTFVYDVLSKTWVRDTYGVSCGVVEEGVDRIYITRPGNDEVLRERKDQIFDDHSDPEYDITISSASGSTVIFTVTGTQVPLAGDVIRQFSTNNQITSVSGSGPYTATMKNPVPGSWAAGAAKIFPGVGSVVRWAPWTGGNPDLLKQVRQLDILIDNIPGNSAASSVTATFVTDFQEEETVVISSRASGWGSSPWGTFPWGGIKDSFVFTTYVPMNSQYCRTMNPGFRFNNAIERIAVAGVGFTFNAISERVGR
jgi:hypothetical protein